MDATTTFDPVDLSGYQDANVSLRLRVRDTTYESPDRLRVFVTDGANQIDLLNQTGSGLNPLATLDYQLYSADIPDSWAQASLVISSFSNSSTGAERFDFDNILFSGVATFLIGDANADRIVDNADLAIVVANYGTTSGATVAQGDFDHNGRVNLQDLVLLKNHFGETLSPAAAIPEPANWGPLLVAMTLIGVLRIAVQRIRGRKLFDLAPPCAIRFMVPSGMPPTRNSR